MVLVISLILIGIVLLLIEFFLVPGITIAGIGGIILIGCGVYFSYENFGATTGNYVLVFTFFLTLFVLYFSLRSRTWKKLMLSTNVEGKANKIEEEKIKVGDVGKTITRLAPIGKVMVNGIFLEGKSTGAFIDENKEIEVVKVLNTQVIVKLK